MSIFFKKVHFELVNLALQVGQEGHGVLQNVGQIVSTYTLEHNLAGQPCKHLQEMHKKRRKSKTPP